MRDALRIPYDTATGIAGEAALLPYLPMTLAYQGRAIAVSGLLDTGATVNVLPYHVGLALGADWNDSPAMINLTGNLAQFAARPLVLTVNIGEFAPVRLVFAWTQAETAPLLFGQVNFFMEFDVCFYRAQQFFEVHPKQES